METGTETPTVNWKMGEGGTSLMGGARNNFKGGEEIGGKEERNGGAIVVKFFFFFFREEKFRLGKALSLLVALSSLSFFFKFFLKLLIKEKKRDESVKVTC